ncbi:CBS domain-containing protein [Bradyrhizobium erythrophlei]|jgi:CBS domain-containing protein|uniref:CBS domain-containing protein n=1 Tax=Bradyrhizobium erythrophlei TaxID=1437360 RepID=A0A1M7TL59_9BRAD|nr:CBS domain-containing protein [Bradyrhizobium erythrophlei]SHN71479.1 CBS domain-containing protein [Bradyrhizobium erythrophlei]
MDHPLRRPEEILAYRPLKQILKSGNVWAVASADTVQTAVRIMEEKNIGFLVVLEKDAIVGVVSERDCLRRVVLAGKTPQATAVKDIMVENVVKVGIEDTFAECLRLMHAHGIRHLPVLEKGRLVGVVSIRDLLREVVEHHARIIGELERERMTMLTSTV